jgi:hypothetical protein
MYQYVGVVCSINKTAFEKDKPNILGFYFIICSCALAVLQTEPNALLMVGKLDKEL